MNIVVITTLSRPQLLQQTLYSLEVNAADWDAHHLTIVVDRADDTTFLTSYCVMITADSVIKLRGENGASRARNIGAGSIPKNRRHEHVMFCDDDCYFLKNWDSVIEDLGDKLPRTILSPYGHPFNIEESREEVPFAKFPLLISSVAMVMRWDAFDEIGYWLEPGGAGASEDFELCSRARTLGYDFAVSFPHACIHTGLTSSTGIPIVGAAELREKNSQLESAFGLTGKVIYG